jgi:hypothetical protein
MVLQGITEDVAGQLVVGVGDVGQQGALLADDRLPVAGGAIDVDQGLEDLVDVGGFGDGAVEVGREPVDTLLDRDPCATERPKSAFVNAAHNDLGERVG